MAGRPKAGLDYSGWSVNIFDGDTKIDRLLDAQGWIGFGVYFYLCQMAYKFDGYFYRWSYGDSATTARRMGGGVRSETVKQTVGLCLQIGLFDKGLFDRDSILTSRGIQRRFCAAIQERRRKVVIGDYWLLDEEESKGLEMCAENHDMFPANGYLPPANGDLPPANAPKSKGKQKESKGKDLSGNTCAEAVKPPRRRKPSSLTKIQQERFDRFWAVYPRKQKLGDAEKVWGKIDPDDALTERIIAAVRSCVAKDFRFREERYTPLPVSWLNNREWENQYGGENSDRGNQQGSDFGGFRPSTGVRRA